MTRSTTQRRLSPQPPREPQHAVSPEKRSLRSMAGESNNGPQSDTEGVEKPVREQLKKANINAAEGGAGAAVQTTVAAMSESERGQDSSGDERGRNFQKKRSFEDDDEEGSARKTVPMEGKHRRKRSRDSTLEENALHNGQPKVSGEEPRDADATEADNDIALVNGSSAVFAMARSVTPEATGAKRTEEPVEGIASPKTKRSRLYSATVDSEEAVVSGKKNVVEAEVQNAKPSQLDGPKKSEALELPRPGGLASTSAVSPFGSLAANPKIDDSSRQASSPFAASGFGALSNSSTSGFGAIGKSSGGFGAGGGFATGGKSSLGVAGSSGEDLASGSAFGSALGQKSAFAASSSTTSGFGTIASSFGTSASGFGKVGQSSGFGGSGFGNLGGGGLSSFASGKPSAGLASTSAAVRGFGALAEDNEDEAEDRSEDAEAGFKSPLSQEDDKQDERFYHQDLETGEEDEAIEYSCRAKLYNFAAVGDGKKEWHERGLGNLRLNVKRAATSGREENLGEIESKTQARFLMRADGSHRVVLNTPIKKEIKFGAPTGGPPQGGYMYFMGTIDKSDGKAGGLELLQLKVRHLMVRSFRSC